MYVLLRERRLHSRRFRKPRSIVSLRQDAWRVGDEGVKDHDDAHPYRIPKEEQDRRHHGQIVRALRSPRLQNELFEILGIGLFELIFCKSLLQDCRTIRQAIFPFFHTKKIVPYFSGFFPFSRAINPIIFCEKAVRQFQCEYCRSHMKYEPRDKIDDDGPEHRQFNNSHFLFPLV